MLADLSLSEIQEYAKNLGLPSFRGNQIFDAVYSGKTLDEISNLSASIKQSIEKDYPKAFIDREFVSKDGTKKFVIRFGDGEICETVLMKYKYGYTLCVSTQVGCRMGCKFCASGLNGLVRNLSAGEILGQVILANKSLGGSSKERKITNIVLMGSGEPLDNYDEVAKFLRLVSAKEGFNISLRNISLSTCGLCENIYRLADEGLSVTLTISLHAPNDELRKKTMPIANKYTIKEILEACRYFIEKTKRRVAIEYTLIKGVNDDSGCAKELTELLKGLLCHVNVIPLNYVKERGLIGTTRGEAYKFVDLLTKGGLSATVRRSLGDDIAGACGQLRNKILGGEA